MEPSALDSQTWSPLDRFVAHELVARGIVERSSLADLYAMGLLALSLRVSDDGEAQSILVEAALRSELIDADELEDLLAAYEQTLETSAGHEAVADTLAETEAEPTREALESADTLDQIEVLESDESDQEDAGPEAGASAHGSARPDRGAHGSSVDRITFSDLVLDGEPDLGLPVHPTVNETFLGERYEVLEPVDGNGSQLRALDRRLQREVVLNTLAEDQGEEGEAAFLRAARILARLDHPSIPRVRDMGKLGERAFYATDALPGIPLELEVLGEPPEHAPAALPGLLRAYLRMAAAVQHAHSVGVIHGRLEPTRVIVGGFGRVWLTGWESARASERATEGVREAIGRRPSSSGTMGAAVETRAPELAASGRADERTDVYGLGLILRFILTGRLPTAEGGADAITRHRRPDGRRVPHELAAIASKTLAPLPADRYESVAELAEDVRRFLDGRRVAAAPETFVRALVRLTRRYPGPSAVVAVVIALLVIGGAVTIERVLESWNVARAAADVAVAAEQRAAEEAVEARRREVEASERARVARMRTSFEAQVDEAFRLAQAGADAESLRRFEQALGAAQRIGDEAGEPEQAERFAARVRRLRASWALDSGRPADALEDYLRLADDEALLGRFLAARRIGDATARGEARAAFAALAGTEGPYAELAKLLEQTERAEALLAAGDADGASRLAADVVERVRAVRDRMPDIALVHEIEGRAVFCLDTRALGAGLQPCVTAIALDPAEPGPRVLLAKQWRDQFGHQAGWRWVSGWYNAQLIAAADLTPRPEPLVELVTAMQQSGRVSGSLRFAERIFERARPETFAGAAEAETWLRADLLRARALLAAGREPGRLPDAADVPEAYAAERAFLLARALITTGWSKEALDTIAAGLKSFAAARNPELALGDLTRALLDEKADGAEVRAFAAAAPLPEGALGERLARRLAAVRAVWAGRLGIDAGDALQRLSDGGLAAGSIDDVLGNLARARLGLTRDPTDPAIHVAALRAWALVNFDRAVTERYCEEARAIVVERLLRFGRQEAARAFDDGDAVAELWVRRDWVPDAFHAARARGRGGR